MKIAKRGCRKNYKVNPCLKLYQNDKAIISNAYNYLNSCFHRE